MSLSARRVCDFLALALSLAACRSKSDPPPVPAPVIERPPVFGTRAGPSVGQLAIDGDRMYFLTELDTNRTWQDSMSVVRARLKSGGEEVELARSTTAFGPSVALDDDNVYAARHGTLLPSTCEDGKLCPRPQNASTGEILAIPKAGGASRVVAGNVRTPGPLAVDASEVFFTDRDTLSRVSKHGGPQTTMAKGLWCHDLAVSDTVVYCGGPDGITRITKNGAARTMLTSDAIHAIGLSVRGDVLIAATQEKVPLVRPFTKPSDVIFENVPRFRLISSLYGDVTTIDVTNAGAELFVADAAKIYWTTSGELRRAPLAGGQPTTTTPFNMDTPVRGLAVDEARVYWVTRNGHPNSEPK